MTTASPALHPCTESGNTRGTEGLTRASAAQGNGNHRTERKLKDSGKLIGHKRRLSTAGWKTASKAPGQHQGAHVRMALGGSRGDRPPRPSEDEE